MKIFLIGACGYKGTVLVPKLLAAGHQVVAFDIMWFGNFLKPHARLRVIRGDVRDIESIKLDGVDAIVHLSSVANDPCQPNWSNGSKHLINWRLAPSRVGNSRC